MTDEIEVVDTRLGAIFGRKVEREDEGAHWFGSKVFPPTKPDTTTVVGDLPKVKIFRAVEDAPQIQQRAPARVRAAVRSLARAPSQA
jgi:hypothetical protein